VKPLRVNSIVVGTLFILGTAFGVLAVSLEGSILNAPDYLAQMAANAGQINAGAFLQFLMAMSCAGIGIALYPVMKLHHEGQAIAVAGFRTIEGMIQVVGGVCTIGLLSVGQEFVRAGTAEAANLQALGTVIRAGSDWLSNGPMLLSWCIAALIYYSVFYQYKLVPRWVSAWGLIGIVLIIVSSVLITLNIVHTIDPFQTFASLPIAVQEMVFAVWLIAKGYSQPATTQQA